MMVKILDKEVPIELILNYITVLWTYQHDDERSRAHDAIFNYMGVNRWKQDTWEPQNTNYFDVIDNIVCEAFCCCGVSVDRNNVCMGRCGTKLTMKMSLFNAVEYCKKLG